MKQPDSLQTKTYYVMHNIGHARYCLNFHDGEKTHKDGSPFFDLNIFSNKKNLARKVKELQRAGYTESR